MTYFSEKRSAKFSGKLMEDVVKGIKPDILLIPPEISQVFSSKSSAFMPLGILSLTANLRNKGFLPVVYKPWKRLLQGTDYEEVAVDILAYKPMIIGFSTWCITYPASLLLAEQIKAREKEIPIVFGGPQATILAEETLRNFKFVDYILAGEADLAIVKLVDCLVHSYGESSLFSVEGLVFRNKEGSIIRNQEPAFVPDLNDLPIPAFDLVSCKEEVRLDVGRGCPFHCTYCTTGAFFLNKYRTKSVDRVITEMDFAADQSGTTHFRFAHDLFTLNNGYISKLCSALTMHYEVMGKSYFWNCSSRIDCVSESLLEQMKIAGCQSIFFGIESGSQKTQELIKKNLDVTAGLKIADVCRNLCMNAYVSFIIGFPDETTDDIEKTLRCIVEFALRGALPQISELALLPGTSLYNENHDKIKFDGLFSNFSYSFCGQPEKDIIQKYPAIFSSFYYLPVEGMDRESLVILCRFVNQMSEFRNTIFLLRDVIEGDLKSHNLIELFHTYVPYIRETLKADHPLISVWIKLLKNYILGRDAFTKIKFLSDVFVWESTQGLMKANFLRWQLIHPKVESKPEYNRKKDQQISVTPYWHILKMNYPLVSIVPSLNGWITKKTGIRKGEYHYLVVSESEKSCNLIRLKSLDYILLKGLMGRPVHEFLDVGFSLAGEKRFMRWISQMVDAGVIEIIEKSVI